MNEHKTYFIQYNIQAPTPTPRFPESYSSYYFYITTRVPVISDFQLPQPSNSAANLLFQPFAFGSCNSVKAAKTKNTEHFEYGHFFLRHFIGNVFPSYTGCTRGYGMA